MWLFWCIANQISQISFSLILEKPLNAQAFFTLLAITVLCVHQANDQQSLNLLFLFQILSQNLAPAVQQINQNYRRGSKSLHSRSDLRNVANTEFLLSSEIQRGLKTNESPDDDTLSWSKLKVGLLFKVAFLYSIPHGVYWHGNSDSLKQGEWIFKDTAKTCLVSAIASEVLPYGYQANVKLIGYWQFVAVPQATKYSVEPESIPGTQSKTGWDTSLPQSILGFVCFICIKKYTSIEDRQFPYQEPCQDESTTVI